MELYANIYKICASLKKNKISKISGYTNYQVSIDFSRYIMQKLHSLVHMPKLHSLVQSLYERSTSLPVQSRAKARLRKEDMISEVKSLFGKAQIYSQTRMREILFGSLILIARIANHENFFSDRADDRAVQILHNDGWFACSAGPKIPKSFYTV